MTTDADRDPSPDEQQGMAWWNALSETKRLFWLQLAGGAAAGASAAAAWAAFKRADPDRDVKGGQDQKRGNG